MNRLANRVLKLATVAAVCGFTASAEATNALPEGYEPIGGVRATAGQIIDTGYVPKANSVYHFAFSLDAGNSAWRGVFGNYIDEDHNATRLIRNNTTATDFLCNNISKAGGGGDILANVNTAQGQRVVGWMDSAQCVLTGGRGVKCTSRVKIAVGLSNETSISLLGAFASESPGTVEMYSFRIEEKQDGDLPNAVVHDHVPVRRTVDGKVGFYDVAEGEFKGWDGETPLEAVDFQVTVKSVIADDRVVKLACGGSFADAVEPSVTVDGVRYACQGYAIHVLGADGIWKSFAVGEDCSFDVTLPIEARQAQVSWNWIRSDIPAGCERVEYLASDGLAYVDTGFVTTPDTEFRFKYAVETGTGHSYAGAFGTYNGEPENCTRIIANNQSSSEVLVNFMNQANKCGSTLLTITARSMDVVEGTMSARGVTLNGVSRAHHATRAANPDTTTIRLFRYSDGEKVDYDVRFWYMQIFENGQLVHSYQPCVSSGGEGVMFDAVTGELLRNDNVSGAFTCGPKLNAGYALTASANGPGGTVAVTLDGVDVNGKAVPIGAPVTAMATPAAGYEFLGWVSVPTDMPTAPAISVRLDSRDMRAEAIFRRQEWSRTVPSGYTRLENIQTTRTQYFDTGFYPCPQTRVDATVRASGPFGDNFHANFFGSQEGAYNFSANLNGVAGGTGNAVGIYVDLSYFDGGRVCERTGDVCYGERTTLRVDSTISVASCGRRTTKQGVVTTHYFGEAPMFIAASTNATDGSVTLLSSFDMDIYDWRMWVGDVPVRDYVPCVDPNGVAGLYDTLGERFVAPCGGAVVSGEAWQGDEWKPSPTFVRFSGENGMLATTENQALSSVTANFWVRNAQVRRKASKEKADWETSDFGVLLDYGAFDRQDGFIIYVQSNRTEGVERPVSLVFQMNVGATEHNMYTDWTDESHDDQWHMVTATYDRETTTKRLYVDGVKRAEGTFVAHDPIANRVFHVGSYFNGAYFYPVVADMAELSIWDRALSPREIKGLRFGPLAGNETGLSSYYPFSDGCAIQMNHAVRAVDSPQMDGMWDSYTFEDGTVAWPKRVGTMLLVR